MLHAVMDTAKRTILLLLLMFSSEVSSGTPSCKRGGSFGFEKTGNCKCDTIWSCFLNRNRICTTSVECDVTDVIDENAIHKNVNVKFNIKNIIATNSFLSNLFGGFTEMRESLSTEITQAVGCTGPVLAVSGIENFDTQYQFLPGLLSVNFDIKVYTSVSDIFTEYSLQDVITTTVADSGFRVDTNSFRHTVTDEDEPEAAVNETTTEMPAEQNNTCAGEDPVDNANTVSFEISFTVVGIKLTQGGLLAARRTYDSLEEDLKTKLSETFGCTGDQPALMSFTNYDSCFGPSNMVVSFTLEIFTASLSEQVSATIETTVTNLVSSTGFTIKDVVIEQNELVCSGEEVADIQFETVSVKCNILNIPNDLTDFYVSVANLDRTLQNEIKTNLGCQGSQPALLYLGEFDLMPNKVTHVMQMSFSLYLAKTQNFTFDFDLIQTKVEALVKQKTGLSVDSSSFEFESETILVEEYVEGDELIEELNCTSESNTSESVQNDHSYVSVSFTLAGIDFSLPRFSTGLTGFLSLFKSGISRKLRDGLGCADGVQSWNKIERFEHKINTESFTIEILLTFDIYTSNAEENATAVSSEELDIISEAIQNATEEMGVQLNGTGIEITAKTMDEEDLCQRDGRYAELELNEVDLTLNLFNFNFNGPLFQTSFTGLLYSFKDDLMVQFDEVLRCAGLKHAMHDIVAVQASGSTVEGTLTLEYKLYIYTEVNDKKAMYLNDTIVSVLERIIIEKLEAKIQTITVTVTVIEEYVDDFTPEEVSCEANGDEEELILNEIDLTLNILDFNFDGPLFHMSFNGLLNTFKDDLTFELTRIFGCVGSTKAVKLIEAVHASGSTLKGMLVLEYKLYIYTSASDNQSLSLNDTINSMLTQIVQEKLEATLDSITITITVIEDFVEGEGSLESCEVTGDEGNVTLTEVNLTLHVADFNFDGPLFQMSLNGLLSSFKADLMFEFERALGCAGSTKAMKMIDAVSASGSFIQKTLTLTYKLYIYISANETQSLEETIIELISQIVIEKLEAKLEETEITIAVIEDFEDIEDSGNTEFCDGNESEELILQEVALTINVAGFDFDGPLFQMSFSGLLNTFRGQLMLEFETALGCAGSRPALKEIESIGASGSTMDGTLTLQYKIYIYVSTSSNDTVSLNESISSIINETVQLTLKATMESITITITIIEDFETGLTSGSCEGNGDEEDLVLNEIDLTLNLINFNFDGPLFQTSFTGLLTSFEADLMFELDKALGCAGSERALKEIKAVHASGSTMEGSLTLQYKLYIYTSASGNDSLSLNETIDSVLTITVEEKLEATLVSITITITIIEETEVGTGTGSTDTCEGSGTDDDLVLNEFHLTLNLMHFNFDGPLFSLSFNGLLKSFKADLMFAFEDVLGCAGSKKALKEIEAVSASGNIMLGSLTLEYKFYIYTSGNASEQQSLEEMITSTLDQLVMEQLEASFEGITITITVVEDFEELPDTETEESCEDSGSDEEVVLNQINATLNVMNFDFTGPMFHMSFSGLLNSFADQLMFELDKSLGCAGSQQAVKMVKAVSASGNAVLGTLTLQYEFYIYTVVNSTTSVSLEETMSEQLEQIVQSTLQAVLDSLTVTITIIEDVEEIPESEPEGTCEDSGEEVEVVLNEIDLTINVNGFDFDGPLFQMSFSGLMNSFKAQLMFSLETALGCAGSKTAMKDIVAVDASGDTTGGQLTLQYKLYIYTSVNGTESLSLNDTLQTILNQTVEETLQASLESITITIIIIEDVEHVTGSDSCEGNGDEEDLVLNEIDLTLNLINFNFDGPLFQTSFTGLLTSFEADLMFELDKALGCAGSERALKEIKAVHASGSTMEGSLTLQYKLYIYTSASGNDSLSLNETIDSVLTITVEEKLEATLVSITITITIIEETEVGTGTGSTDTCEGSGTDDDLVLNEFHLTLNLMHFNFDGPLFSLSFNGLLKSFKADLMFAFEDVLGCAGSKKALKEIEAVSASGNIMLGSLTLEYKFYIYTSGNASEQQSLEEMITSTLDQLVMEQLEASFEGITITITVVEDFEELPDTETEESCEDSGSDEEVVLNQINATLNVMNFDFTGPMFHMSFSGLLNSFADQLMFELDKSLGCAGSQQAVKMVKAVSASGNAVLGTLTLQYEFYIYTVVNSTTSVSLEETMSEQLEQIVQSTLQAVLDSLTVTITIIEDVEEIPESEPEGTCEDSGEEVEVVLNEIDLTINVNGFDFDGPLFQMSFSGLMNSFKAQLMFSLETALGCAGSKTAMKDIVAVDASGDTTGGQLTLQYKLYIYTSVNGTESLSLNDTLQKILNQTVEETLQASLESITITIIIIDDVEHVTGSDSCEGNGDEEDLVLNEIDLTLNLINFNFDGPLFQTSFTGLLTSFEADLMFELDKALGCAGSERALKEIKAVHASGSTMEGSLTLQYKLYIYTSASGNDSLSLNETIDSVLTITVEEKLEATLVSITITITVIEDNGSGTEYEDSCEGRASDEDLILNQINLTLNIMNFNFHGPLFHMSFNSLLISFKADLTFALEAVLGCAGSKSALKLVEAVEASGNLMEGSLIMKYNLYVYTINNDNGTVSLEEVITTTLSKLVEEQLECSLEGTELTLTVIEDFEENMDTEIEESCEKSGSDEELVLNQINVTLNMMHFDFTGPMFHMSFTELLNSFADQLMFDLSSDLGCAGSTYAMKKVVAVGAEGNTLLGSLTLKYELYIYTVGNDTDSLQDNINSLLTQIVEQRLEASLEYVTVTITIIEEFEVESSSEISDSCEASGDEEVLLLQEIDLEIDLVNFDFNGPMFHMSFSGLLESFKIQLMFALDNALGCAGSKKAMKWIQSIHASGSTMEGSLILEYKLFIYTVANDTESANLNETLTSVLNDTVTETLEATLQSISLTVTIIEDFTVSWSSEDICEDGDTEEDLILNKINVTVDLMDFDFNGPLFHVSFSGVLLSFKEELMFDFNNILGCVGSEKALKQIEAVDASGNVTEGTLTLQYTLYIYTSANASVSISLNETITSVITQMVEEKLQANLTSLTITITIVEDFEEVPDSVTQLTCEEDDTEDEVMQQEVGLVVNIVEFNFDGPLFHMSLSGLLDFLKEELTIELGKVLGCAGSKQAMDSILGIQASTENGTLTLEYKLSIYLMKDDEKSVLLNQTITSVVIRTVREKMDAIVQSMKITFVTIDYPEETDCSENEPVDTEEMGVDITFTLLGIDYSAPGFLTEFASQFSLFQSTITSKFTSTYGCAGAEKAFQELSGFKSTYDQNNHTLAIYFRLTLHITSTTIVTRRQITAILVSVVSEAMWQVDTESITIEAVGNSTFTEYDYGGSGSGSGDWIDFSGFDNSSGVFEESGSGSGSGDDDFMVDVNIDDEPDCVGEPVTTTRLSVQVSFTLINVDFFGSDLVSTLASINFLEGTLLSKITNAMGCQGDVTSVSALDDYEAVPNAANNSVGVGFNLIILTSSENSYRSVVLTTAIRLIINRTEFELDVDSITTEERVLPETTTEPALIDPENPVCTPLKLEWTQLYVYRMKVRLYGVNYVDDLSDPSSDVYAAFTSTLSVELSHRLGCTSKNLKGVVQVVSNFTFSFGSIVAEFDLGTSSNNVTTDDIKEDVNEQLSAMGMEPDPTETETTLKKVPDALVSDNANDLMTWVIVASVVAAVLFIAIIIIACLYLGRRRRTPKTYPAPDYGPGPERVYRSNSTRYWRQSTPSYTYTDETAYDLQKNSVYGLAPAVSMEAPSDWKMPRATIPREFTWKSQRSLLSKPVAYDGYYS